MVIFVAIFHTNSSTSNINNLPMEAILKFDLDDFDDKKAHLRCIKSFDLAYAVWEFVHNSRKKLRNEDKFTVDDVFDHFHTLLEENNINIDELID